MIHLLPPATAHVPLFLYPFLNTTSKTRPFEYLRLTSLGVIGALVKVGSISMILPLPSFVPVLSLLVCTSHVSVEERPAAQYSACREVGGRWHMDERSVWTGSFTQRPLNNMWHVLGQVDDTEVINFLLSTEIIPLCLRTMEMGSELSKTVATFIVQKILLDNVGLNYICATAERFFAVGAVLGNMVRLPCLHLFVVFLHS